MMALINPAYFVPIHGEVRHMLQHERIAVLMGMHKKNIFIPTLEVLLKYQKGFDNKGNVLDSVYMIMILKVKQMKLCKEE